MVRCPCPYALKTPREAKLAKVVGCVEVMLSMSVENVFMPNLLDRL